VLIAIISIVKKG